VFSLQEIDMKIAINPICQVWPIKTTTTKTGLLKELKNLKRLAIKESHIQNY
jgi:hypothetical protein